MQASRRSQRDYKERLYAQFAHVGRALASPRRLEILDLLAQGERTVETLAAEVGTTVSNISQHLQILRSSGLIQSHKVGLYVRCSLAGNEVLAFWMAMRHLTVGLSPELRELLSMYVERRDQLEQIKQAELLQRMREGHITVLDVRPGHEFSSGHIPHAVSIPLDELEARMKELPHSGEIVAYCRGPYCLLSVEAVERLRAAGYQARRLEDGFPEWQSAGLPVESDKD